MEGAQPPPAAENRRKLPSPFAAAGLMELRCATLPPEGVEVSIEINGTDPLTARVWDVSRGLPPQGQFLVDARPKNTCPVQNGDETLVSQEINL
jgi:hypothetical protein